MKASASARMRWKRWRSEMQKQERQLKIDLGICTVLTCNDAPVAGLKTCAKHTAQQRARCNAYRDAEKAEAS